MILVLNILEGKIINFINHAINSSLIVPKYVCSQWSDIVIPMYLKVLGILLIIKLFFKVRVENVRVEKENDTHSVTHAKERDEQTHGVLIHVRRVSKRT